jgi:hypothetical protein
VEFKSHDYSCRARCIPTAEDREGINAFLSFLSSYYANGALYLAGHENNPTLFRGTNELSSRDYLMPIMGSLLSENPTSLGNPTLFGSSLDFALKLHDAYARDRGVWIPKLLESALAFKGSDSSLQMFNFLRIQVKHLPLTTLRLIYQEVDNWGTEARRQILVLRRWSDYLYF